MKQRSFLGPVLLRFGFFALNLYFTIHVTISSGWNFFSIILAMFATREFVGTIQAAQVVSHIKKRLEQESKQDNK